MAYVARYPDAEIGERQRPQPGETLEDYRLGGTYSPQWGTNMGPVYVERIGDNHPTEEWKFSHKRTGERDERGAYKIRVAPRVLVFTPLSRGPNGTPSCRYRRRNEKKKTHRVTLDEVPEPVKTLLRDAEGVELVETLG